MGWGRWIFFSRLNKGPHQPGLSEADSAQGSGEPGWRRESSARLENSCASKLSLGNAGIRATAPSPWVWPPHWWSSAGSCRGGAGWDPQHGLLPRLEGSPGRSGLHWSKASHRVVWEHIKGSYWGHTGTCFVEAQAAGIPPCPRLALAAAGMGSKGVGEEKDTF